MDPSDNSALPFIGEPTEQEKTAALVRALRGQQNLAYASMLSGNPTLANTGQHMLQSSGNELENYSPGARLTQALQQQRLKEGNEELGPASPAYEKIAQQYGGSVEGLNTRQAEKAVNLFEKAFAAKQQADWHRVMATRPGLRVNPVTGEVYDTHGGQPTQPQAPSQAPLTQPGQQPPASALGQEPPEPKEPLPGSATGKALAHRWEALDRVLNPNVRGAGEMGKNQARLNAAQRLKALIYEPGSLDVRDLDPREIQELAIGMQNMLSSGGHSVAEVEDLVPHTGALSGAKIVEWLLSRPQGAGVKAFAEKMGHTVDREEQTAANALHDAQYGALPQFTDLAKFKKKFGSVLTGRGLDPGLLDENLLRKAQKAAPASSVVTVISPEGKRGVIPEANLEAAKARGFKVVGQ